MYVARLQVNIIRSAAFSIRKYVRGLYLAGIQTLFTDEARTLTSLCINQSEQAHYHPGEMAIYLVNHCSFPSPLRIWFSVQMTVKITCNTKNKKTDISSFLFLLLLLRSVTFFLRNSNIIGCSKCKDDHIFHFVICAPCVRFAESQPRGFYLFFTYRGSGWGGRFQSVDRFR